MLLPLAWGCADLELIGPNECGNHVLESPVGEECDGEPGCGSPNTPAACRFTCQGGASCPAGYGCGVDEICRKPAGAFESLMQPGLDINLDLVVADADGDGRDDVLRIGGERGSLEFFGDGGVSETISAIGRVPSNVPSPVITDLDGDGLGDVALNVDGLTFLIGGIAVYRLQPDRRLESTVYASLAIDGNVLRGVSARVLPPHFDDEVLAFVDGLLVGVDTAVNPKPLAHGTSHDAADIDGMVAADFDETAPCDLLAVADGGASTVSVINPCVVLPDGKGNPEVQWRLLLQGHPADVTTVTLPAAIRDFADDTLFGQDPLRHALFAADWNDDGHLDLVAVPQSTRLSEIFVAFGQGDGTFHSETTPPVAGPDGAAGIVNLEQDFPAIFDCGGIGMVEPQGEPTSFSGATVLALADFDGAGGLDIVRDDGIFLRGGEAGSSTCGINWLSALVGDFDGNGTPDVAVSRRDASGIDYLGGAGDGSFARTAVATTGLVRQLASGDYDGDVVTDLAFSETIVTTDLVETSLGVAFGRGLSGPPEPPVTVGRVSGIEHLISARFLRGDSIDDLAVLAKRDDVTALALIAGDTSRELSAPFLLTLDALPQPVPQSIETLASGTFGPGLGPLATLAREVGEMVIGRRRPWLLNASDDAELTGILSGSFDDANAGFSCLSFFGNPLGGCPVAAVDLTSDGVDELIVFDGSEIDFSRGIVHTLSVSPAGFTLESSVDLDARVETQGFFGPNRPLVRDLDGDGRRDVVVRATDALTGLPILVVLFNDGDGSLSAPSVLSLEMEDVQSATVIELDGDPWAEIAVGTQSSEIRFFEVTGARTIVPIADPDIAGVVPDPILLASGDVDGDGVEDLVVGGFQRYALLRGRAVKP